MPTTGVELSVVIPVYNNAATLDELLDRIVAVVEPMGLAFEVILVDDGSSDRSLAILQARAARDPRIRAFALVRNFGSQSAVCAGFDQVRGRLAMCMDADLENLPEDIPALLEPLGSGYDLTCGYREERSSPWLTRRLPSMLLNAYVRRQTGIQVRDVGCGMRGFKAWVVKDLESEGEARRLLTPVFLRRAHRVTEVPLRHGATRAPGGHSFLTLLGIAVDYYMLTARRPFLVSGLIAAGATAAGIGFLAAGQETRGLVLTCAGLLGGLLSLIGEYGQRLYQLGQGVPFYKLRNLDGDGEA
jgi:glycosyltransferase involved in cell wall biosynthesis